MSHYPTTARDGTAFEIIECGSCAMICEHGDADILKSFGMAKGRIYWAVQWDQDGWRWGYCPRCNMIGGYSLDVRSDSQSRPEQTVPTCASCTRLTAEVERLNKILDLHATLLYRYADADDIEYLTQARKGP